MKFRKIICIFLQADTSYMDDGTLNGAMSEEMAMQAMTCLVDAKYVKLNTSHVTNLEVPGEFSELLIDFFLGV